MEKLLKDALDRFDESHSGTSFNRTAATDDVRFARLGEQWPDAIKKQRQQENRPCLTINRLPAFIRQVVNDARQNKPGIQVSPVDSGADPDTAEVISGIIRSIENGRRKAEVAYDTAVEHAVTGGFGFFRIGIDYVHEDTFDMEAYIERVPNPLMVHWDPSGVAFDASDWRYAFVSDFLSEKEFKAKYPGASHVSFEGSSDEKSAHWQEDEKIRVAEYWYKTEKKRKLYLLSDGRTLREDQLPMVARQFAEAGGLDTNGMSDDALSANYLALMGVSVVREREAAYSEVKRATISGADVLDEDVWPGSTIPICPVWGEEVIHGGRRHFRSMIRDARDPQTMFNFWRTASTELVALAPKAPFLVEDGGIPDDEADKWETANARSHPYLLYSKGSKMPQRQRFASVPTGALNEAAVAADDMKSIMSIYDSALGAQSNETSGKAILARQRESDVANFHFIDNLNRAIEYAGRVLVEIIPHVYTERSALRIIGDDQKEKVIRLSNSTEQGIDDERIYDLNVGRYDVTVASGPSTATQRQETRDLLIEFMRALPQSAPLIADVMFENSDFKGADKLAERARLLLPPQVQAAESGQPIPGVVPGQTPAVPDGQGGIPAPQ